jgi:uncharacterized protein involved in oxidation of intracellular sulfur
MTILVVLNDAPYASERPYNALRLASSLAEDGNRNVRLFLIGDGAWCAVKEQAPPEGMHDIEWMLRRFLAGGREVAVCKTCMEARGITDDRLIEGTRRGTLDELTRWTVESDRVLVF